jgi:hypothetical protein
VRGVGGVVDPHFFLIADPYPDPDPNADPDPDQVPVPDPGF